MNIIYKFDEQIDRHHTGALKTDVLQERYGRTDLLPLWVADMDFATPSFILDAMRKRLRHPILGYTVTEDGYWESIIDWMEYRHGWKVERDWLSYVPGIVTGIGMVLQVFSEDGDKVIIQSPVYHPFRLVPEMNGREVVRNPLINQGDHYEMDFEKLESVIDERCKILILCNPHNPGGRVWNQDELVRLADICARHHILVISDEIHSDMALFGHKHIPFASVSEMAAQNSITFAAPTKTFNMAGIISSFSIIENEDIRSKFYGWMSANEFNAPSIFALVATQSAYKEGHAWLEQMLSYVEQNILFVERYLHDYIPRIKMMRPQASFLVWLDCRELNLPEDGLSAFFVDKVRLALNNGVMFGPQGKGYMRMNVGTPRVNLEVAMERLRNAVDSIG